MEITKLEEIKIKEYDEKREDIKKTVMTKPVIANDIKKFVAFYNENVGLKQLTLTESDFVNIGMEHFLDFLKGFKDDEIYYYLEDKVIKNSQELFKILDKYGINDKN